MSNASTDFPGCGRPLVRAALVDGAEIALRATGAATRDEAADQLRMFTYHDELTIAERASLLDRFPGIACAELLAELLAEADSYTT